MTEEFQEDYIGDEILDGMIPNINEEDAEEEGSLSRGDEEDAKQLPKFDKLGRQRYRKKKTKPWFTAPKGVPIYEKYRDTFALYGFQRGSDAYSAAFSKKQDTDKMRHSATYKGPTSAPLNKRVSF